MFLQGQLGIRKSHNGFGGVLIGPLEFFCCYSSLIFPHRMYNETDNRIFGL